MRGSILWLVLALLITTILLTAQADTLVIYPAPGDLSSVEGLWPSRHFEVMVANQPVFVYETDMGWSFFNFATTSVTEISVRFSEPIETFEIRPRAAQVAVTRTDQMLQFRMPPTTNLVVQINHDYKLLISADPPEEAVPQDSAEDIHYFGVGVHHVGENYSPNGLQDGDTIYIAGGAVVEGLFKIANVQNLTIRGRGVVAMGEWHWTDPVERSGMVLRPKVDKLYIEGITLVKSPGWQLSLGDSDAVVEHVKLLGVGNWYNSDGIQTWVDNHHTIVRDSFIFARDDALNLNAGTYDFLADNLVLWNDRNGASIMLGWGGAQDSERITVRNTTILENNGIGVFSARWGDVEQHIVRDVLFENIVIENATTFIDMLITATPWTTGNAGRFEGMSFINIQTPSLNGIILGNSETNSFNHIHFVNLRYRNKLITKITDIEFVRIHVFDFVISPE